MRAEDEEHRNRCKALSAEIGKLRRSGLPVDHLVAEHRELSRQVRDAGRPGRQEPRLVVEEITDGAALERLADAWRRLGAQSDAYSPSMAWEWLFPWYSCFGGRHRLRVVTVTEQKAGELVALLPLLELRRSRHMPTRHVIPLGTGFGPEVVYSAPLLSAEMPERAAEMLVGWLQQEAAVFLASNWDLGADSGKLFVELLEQAGFATLREPVAPTVYDVLPGSFAEFAQNLVSRRRWEIRQYARRGCLEDGEYVLEVHREAPGILAELHVLKAFTNAKYGRFSAWRYPRFGEWSEQVIHLGSPSLRPSLWVLVHQGTPVSAALGWICRSSCLVTGFGHDLGQRDQRPGHLLFVRLIAWLIEHGVESLDFGPAPVGRPSYKTHYLRQLRPRVRLIAAPPGMSLDAALGLRFALELPRRPAKWLNLYLQKRSARAARERAALTKGQRQMAGSGYRVAGILRLRHMASLAQSPAVWALDAAGLLPRIPPRGGVCLCYHSVLPGGTECSSPYTPLERFRRQMGYVREHFVLVTASELWAQVQSGTWRGRRLLAVTFDDARRSVYEHVRPICQEHGIPLTVFPTCNWADAAGPGAAPSNVARGFSADAANAFMNWAQVAELAEEGHEIGAHTLSHPHLGQLSLSDAEREIRDSKATVEEQIGRPITAFAYPYGHRSDATEDLQRCVAQAGFGAAWSTDEGWVTPQSNPWFLPRIMIGPSLVWTRYLTHIHFAT